MVSAQNIGKKHTAFLSITIGMIVFAALFAFSASAATDAVRPTISSITPWNNVRDIATDSRIIVVFSEDMDPSSINADTFTVMQRPTPQLGEYEPLAISGAIAYADRTAVFTPSESLSPNQRYGNVFTVRVTEGVKDIAGNAIARDYVSSFTSGLDRFNTGDTTSQQDQSSTPVSVSEPVLPQAPPVTAPAAAAPAVTNTFPTWAILGILLLAIALVLFIFATRRSWSRPKGEPDRAEGFGDMRPVQDIEGIGPEYGKELRAMGITNTKQLWEANPARVSRRTGASLTAVESWQHMAELASVKDIGPQYAELLERSGIHSVEQLKNTDPKALLKLVRKKQDSLKVNIQGNSPGDAMVENWIHEAQEHRIAKS